MATLRGCCVLVLRRTLAEFSFFDQLTGLASPTYISAHSSIRGLGAGLFSAWADPDYGWESTRPAAYCGTRHVSWSYFLLLLLPIRQMA
jgi:hypothetical protein